ncbi:maleylpyruvate isomerase family mycothiol-dependent enzyme [Streptomyces atriruber]|uniref:maleylpyruvate isomerase family mycothiol-dependent enzyme n=1 Tax=Streptomyces atriruber TaxID=545121 RepID=UPI0006E24F4A|nr:maleylpyruvate isomerase family mycothiol-dependent enzyme [Streptomyces atriruber]
MTSPHEEVRDLLGAWALDALMPGDEGIVVRHLGECEHCAVEAVRLRATVRHLDGPDASVPEPDAAPGPHGLSLALRSRAPALRTAPHAAPYAAAVAGLQALLAELDEHGPWGTPVVHDWDVHDTVAHLVAADEPLARLLGRNGRGPVLSAQSVGSADATPECTSSVDGASPWRVAWEARTREAIRRERARTPAQTVSTWRNQAAGLLSSRAAHDTELASRATLLNGVRLPVADHFLARAFESWVHAQDIGGALDRVVPPPPSPHLWQLVRFAVRILGPALGPQAPPVALTVAGEGGETEWVLGSADDPVRAELVMDPVDFCLLVGGRRTPERVPRGTTGDESAARRVLNRAASLSWL